MKPSFYLTPLSNVQKSCLSILARQAFVIARSRGAVDDDTLFDDWRRAGQLEACGVDSLREANQGHYLAVRGKWFVILGNLEQAFYDMLNAGADNEARRQMAWRLLGHVAILADGIRTEKARISIILEQEQAATEAWNYTVHLCRDKFQNRRIDTLDADDLKELAYTVLNRANAKLGKGSPENRNKSQRRASTAKKPLKTPQNGSLEPFERPLTRSTVPAHEQDSPRP